MRRIDNPDMLGYPSSHVVSEVSHRLMTLEAQTLLGWPAAGIGTRLRTPPALVKKLSAFRRAVETNIHSRLQVLMPSPAEPALGAALGQQIGLLSDDGLVVAVMQSHA